MGKDISYDLSVSVPIHVYFRYLGQACDCETQQRFVSSSGEQLPQAPHSSPLTAGGLHPLHALPGQRRLHRLDPGRARDPLQVSGCMVTMTVLTVITIPAATAWSSATRATTASCCRPSRSSPPARRCGPSTWPWPGRSSRPSPHFNVRLVLSCLVVDNVE